MSGLMSSHCVEGAGSRPSISIRWPSVAACGFLSSSATTKKSRWQVYLRTATPVSEHSAFVESTTRCPFKRWGFDVKLCWRCPPVSPWPSVPTSAAAVCPVATSSSSSTSTGEPTTPRAVSTQSPADRELEPRFLKSSSGAISFLFRYSGELHLVHYNSKYANIAEAAANKDGIAVLGIFLQVETDELFHTWDVCT